MTRHRLSWQLVLGGLLLLGGAVLVAVVVLDRTDGPGRGIRSRLRGFGEVAMRVVDASGRTRRGCALLARTERQQERGLMEVQDRTLGGYDGMVFQFERTVRDGFWMRNTPMPLSIAYLDRAGRVVSVTDMAPCGDSPSCPSYQPAGPYWSAIEVPRGGLARLGIERGSRVKTGGRCGGPAPN